MVMTEVQVRRAPGALLMLRVALIVIRICAMFVRLRPMRDRRPL